MAFTPVQTFLGGLLLHLSTTGLLNDTGRIFGISGVLDGALLGDRAKWRWALLAGLLSGPAIVAATGLAPALPDNGLWAWSTQPAARLALAGALVGFGSRLGSGCTSGHMLCGVSRLSQRSLVATAVFFLTAVATAKIFPANIHGVKPAYVPVYPTAQQTVAIAAVVGLAILARKAVNSIVANLKHEEGKAPRSWLCGLPYLLSGVTFSLGLVVSGMVSPLKVMGFLRMPPPMDSWDPSLGLVMVGGVLPNAISYFSKLKQCEGTPKTTFNWESWRVPTRKDIDWRLVAGAFAFGVGWGLCGVCPGPAVVTGAQLAVSAVQGVDVTVAVKGWASFAVNLVAGMFAANLV